MNKQNRYIVRWLDTNGQTWTTKKMQHVDAARKVRSLMRRKLTSPNIRHIYLFPSP